MALLFIVMPELLTEVLDRDLQEQSTNARYKRKKISFILFII